MMHAQRGLPAPASFARLAAAWIRVVVIAVVVTGYSDAHAQSCARPAPLPPCDPAQITLTRVQGALDAGKPGEALALARCLQRSKLATDEAWAVTKIEGVAATLAGRHADARMALERALALAGASKSRQGETLTRLGDLFERQKQHGAAEAHYRRALDLLDAQRDSSEVMRAWLQWGDIHVAQGRFEDGLSAYQSALRAAQTANLPAAIARAHDYLGFAYRKLGDFDQALEQHGKAIDVLPRIAADADRRRAEARARNHMGLAYQARAASRRHEASGAVLADLRAAAEQETGAEKALAGHADDTRLGYVLRALSSIHLELASADDPARREFHWQNAAAAADQALRSAEHNQNAEWRGLAYHTTARIQAQRARYAEAQTSLARAESIWRCINDRHALGQAHLIWAGQVALPMRDPLLARTHYDAALREFTAIGAQDELATVYLQLGRLHETGGDLMQAKASYLRAIEIVERTRAALTGDDNRLTFFARRLAPYEALISLLLRGAGSGGQGVSQDDIDAAFRLSERARARGLMDHLTRQADAAAAVRSDGAGTGMGLGEGDILLQYFIGADKSYVFLMQRGKPLRALPLDAPRDAMAILVLQFRRPFEELKSKANAIDAGAFLMSPASFDFAAARQLYDRLLRPVQALVAGAARLTIVPHGALSLLPFEALAAEVPPPGEFVETLRKTRFALDVLPPLRYAAAAGALAADSNNDSLVLRRQRMAAFIDPVTARAPLHHARAELTSIAQIFRGRVDIHRREAATRQRFLQDVGGYESLYVSTHGEFNELAPWLSGFWLSDGSRPEGVLVTAQDIARLRLRAALVTIRACEVAVGRVVDGEGLTGLTRALKAAGAQNLVMSLWVVDDQSSAGLLMAFYRRHAGMGLARALREAKLDLKAAAPRLAHPFFWAPFILMQ